MSCPTITRTEIDDLIDGASTGATGILWRKIDPNQLARARGTKTPLRRRAAFIAVARDAVAAVLIERHGLKGFQQLTKAIRAADPDADFDQINRAAGAALFPSEV